MLVHHLILNSATVVIWGSKLNIMSYLAVEYHTTSASKMKYL